MTMHWAKLLKRAHVPEPEASARYLVQAAATVQTARSRGLCRDDVEKDEA